MEIYQKGSFKRMYLFLVVLTFALQPWLGASCPGDGCARYNITNIVSNVPGGALREDPNLINSWGLSVNNNGRLFVAINGKGQCSSYGENGRLRSTFNVDESPTGIARNDNSEEFEYLDSDGKPIHARFIFATQSGEIFGFNPNATNPNAVPVVNTLDAVYTGIAIAAGSAGEQFLYVANFRNATIDIFNNTFGLVAQLANPDTIHAMGYAPFNIVNINNTLYVTYAKGDEVGEGHGFVYTLNPLTREFTQIVAHGELNLPWGLAVAPDSGFGKFSGALLVGNLGNGKINAYNKDTGAFLGHLEESENGNPIIIDGLWSLVFKRDKDTRDLLPLLYFTAGPNNRNDGLIGSIEPKK